MSSEVKWIKVVTDIFDDEKILLIESLPEADSIIVCWFKILCLAGKQNNSGVLMLSDRIPYTEEMLASIFRRPLQTVRLALTTFEKFGMIEILNGVVTIPNWEKHQSLDAYEKKKERDRLYQASRREKQRLLSEKSSDSRMTDGDTSLEVVGTDIDIDLDKESDKDLDISVQEPVDEPPYIPPPVLEASIQPPAFVLKAEDTRKIMDAWNSLGLQTVKKIDPETDRGKMLRKRVKDYGLDAVLQAIENIRQSSFLMGKNDRGWEITFDWFVKPNNFPKVLEGNYNNRPQQPQRPPQRSGGNPFLAKLEGKL